jgi:hypothetical protein
MLNRKYYFLLLSVVLYTSFFIENCKKKKTDFDRIKEILKKISIYTEEKNYNEIFKYISNNYKDNNNRNKSDIEKLINGYLKRYRGISVSILEIRNIQTNIATAKIEADVFLSNGLSKIIRSIGITGGYYKFYLEFDKEFFWKIKYANWTNISKDKLSVESLNLLEKLFD